MRWRRGRRQDELAKVAMRICRFDLVVTLAHEVAVAVIGGLASAVIKHDADRLNDRLRRGAGRAMPLGMLCRSRRCEVPLLVTGVSLESDSTTMFCAALDSYHAYRAAGVDEVPAEVRTGTLRDAVLYSVGANAAHGLRRSNAGKRRAVETLLADAEWAAW